MKHPYALIPRVHRYLKDGKAVPNTVVNLLRRFPQLFDDLPQIITKYRAEPLFSTEPPDLDWVVVACEALPESRNTNFMEQRIVIRQYSRWHNARETHPAPLPYRRTLRHCRHQRRRQREHPQQDRRPRLRQCGQTEFFLHQLRGEGSAYQRRESGAEVSTDETLPRLVIRIPAAHPVPAAVPPHALPIRKGELSPLRSVLVGPALAVEHPASPA